MNGRQIGAVIIGLVLSMACSTGCARAQAVTADPAGVWRGTSRCTKRPSACKDEIVVYHVTRVNMSDSLSFDGYRIVNGQEEGMGVIGCRVSGTQIRCPMPNGVWYFKVRRDSLVGELRLPDNSQYRDVRTARSH